MLAVLDEKVTRARKTYEDYLQIPDYPRYELLDGEFIVTPSPSSDHQGVSFELSFLLAEYLRKHKIGRAFAAPMDVVFDRWNVCQPDLLFVSNERARVITPAAIMGAPDLVMELLSPTTQYYDLTKKKELYERFGVLEYWIVDTIAHSITIFSNRNGKFQQTFSGSGSEAAQSEVLPGFSVAVEELFKR